MIRQLFFMCVFMKLQSKVLQPAVQNAKINLNIVE